jgi:hypothetical protein
MTSRRAAAAAGTLVLGALLGARSAPAAPAPVAPAPATPAPGAAATPDPATPPAELIGDAVAEYDAGRYEEARALFRAAHDKAPTARTLRGIGMASFELRDYVEAVRALGGALTEQRRALTDEQRQQVQQLLGRAETFVGRFALKLQPPDAALTVDDKPSAREADGTLLLPFGHHRVAAHCATCQPSQKELEVDVIGGEHRDLEIVLGAAGVPPMVGSPQDGGGSPVVIDRKDAGASGGDKTPYWWAGASAAALLGATAGGLYWGNRAHELDTCRMAGDRCKNESTLATERNLAIGVTMSLGAVAVTAGIIAAVTRKSGGSATSTVACGVGKGAVACAFRF